MRAISLHRDVIVVTSAILQVNCVIVRGAGGEFEDIGGAREKRGEAADALPQTAADAEAPHRSGETGDARRQAGETFVIDSPVLPDELDALPALVEQARFPAPSGLLVTHGDWDHLLGRLAFPGVPLGAAETTAERLRASPGDAQRDLRAFDEGLLIERQRPLTLGSVQTLPVPGRCAVGDRELELYAASGHTADGMAVLIPWALVLVAGDYLSTIELPTLNDGGELQAYLATLERLRALVAHAEHVIPGHGPVLSGEEALMALEEDAAYLQALAEHGPDAELPARRRGAAQRRLHRENSAAL
jgi:glyoxylase-like metal-dependent hydrolase (beta-lactamase superfamily II)